jgi:hypothetical protein
MLIPLFSDTATTLEAFIKETCAAYEPHAPETNLIADCARPLASCFTALRCSVTSNAWNLWIGR